jgi:hypothetical protein
MHPQPLVGLYMLAGCVSELFPFAVLHAPLVSSADLGSGLHHQRRRSQALRERGAKDKRLNLTPVGSMACGRGEFDGTSKLSVPSLYVWGDLRLPDGGETGEIVNGTGASGGVRAV